MTSVRTGGKSDVISCHFEFFKVLTLFSTRLLLEMMYFTVQTVTEPKKNDFKSWNPTSELQNLRKQPKTMKMTPKMTETIRGTCGGQRGTVGDRFGVTYEGSWSNQKPENSFETRLCSSKTIKNRLKSSKNDVFDDLLRTFGSFWVNFQHMKWLLIGSVSFRNTKKIIHTMIITVFTT